MNEHSIASGLGADSLPLSLSCSGACNNKCPTDKGTPSCNNGACSYSSCKAPFSLVNGDCQNINTQTDPNNCGAVGKVCKISDFPNASGVQCVASSCVPSCKANFDCEFWSASAPKLLSLTRGLSHFRGSRRKDLQGHHERQQPLRFVLQQLRQHDPQRPVEVPERQVHPRQLQHQLRPYSSRHLRPPGHQHQRERVRSLKDQVLVPPRRWKVPERPVHLHQLHRPPLPLLVQHLHQHQQRSQQLRWSRQEVWTLP